MTEPNVPFSPEHVHKLWRHRDIWCMLTKAPFGSFNGYVRLPKEHPWREFEHYDQLPVEVHGGLTYGPRPSYEFAGRRHEAHTWKDVMYWVGFDTSHAFDTHMDTETYIKSGGKAGIVSVWTAEDVTEETERLADQVADARDAIKMLVEEMRQM